MKRRKFVKNATFLGMGTALLQPAKWLMPGDAAGELLYNGIRLPEVWPPRHLQPEFVPMSVPYLQSPPAVIKVDVGRQLFVDDFLIERHSLNRVFHYAKKIEANPIFQAETAAEKRSDRLPGATPKDGGIWWDDKDQLFKMWYEASWSGTLAYAVSHDGIHWERPELDLVKGTNIILPDIVPDSTTVFIDHFTKDPAQRYKLFLRGPNRLGMRPFCLTSADGIHWSSPVKGGISGDRSTMFFNPFRKKWVYSLRSTKELGPAPQGRCRYYYEHEDFLKGADWDDKTVYWTGADYLDYPDPMIGDKPQLYNLSAVGYESIMLGFHQIHLGPANEECLKRGEPKITELMLSFSRDGFHWDRPDRKAFIKAERTPGSWDRGYVQSVGGICTVVGDELRFHFIGYKGDPANRNKRSSLNGMYSHGATGVAVLRRDGFASMGTKTTGELVTRPIQFTGSHLFVNTDCPQGELLAEILDEQYRVIAPFSIQHCKKIAVNSTRQQVQWNGTEDLASIAGKNVRLRFRLTNGKLYSFWISPGVSGSSNGYMAAGGPGIYGGVDTAGDAAYKAAAGYSKLLKL
jgi:hypothetical protein